MKLTLPEKLVVGSSAIFGVLAEVGVCLFVRAYEQIPSSVAIDNWPTLVVRFLSNVALLLLSTIGFFGVLFCAAQRTRTYAFVFVVGVCSSLMPHGGLRWC